MFITSVNFIAFTRKVQCVFRYVHDVTRVNLHSLLIFSLFSVSFD